MHNMVMAMKAAHESAGIGSYPAQLQDNAQRSAGAPGRLDATSRLKELLNQTLKASTKSGEAVPADDEARFASSAFKQGPAATYVPLPSRWGSFEIDSLQGDAQELPFSLHPDACAPLPATILRSSAPAESAVEAAGSKSSKRIAAGSEAKVSNTTDTHEKHIRMSITADPVAVATNRLVPLSPNALLPSPIGPSPHAILQRETEMPPYTEIFKNDPGLSCEANFRHTPKSSRGKTPRSVAGANAISEKTKTYGGKKQPSGSSTRTSQQHPPKEKLPGGIKLPSAVAKLLAETSTNNFS